MNRTKNPRFAVIHVNPFEVIDALEALGGTTKPQGPLIMV
jgi:hypothetical protein